MGSNSCTRLFSLSTHVDLPGGVHGDAGRGVQAAVAPCRSRPTGRPREPSGESLTMRSLPVSATNTSPRPEGATATAAGWLKAPGALPDAPLPPPAPTRASSEPVGE